MPHSPYQKPQADYHTHKYNNRPLSFLYHTGQASDKNGCWHAGPDDFENKRIRTSQDSYQKEKQNRSYCQTDRPYV